MSSTEPTHFYATKVTTEPELAHLTMGMAVALFRRKLGPGDTRPRPPFPSPATDRNRFSG